MLAVVVRTILVDCGPIAHMASPTQLVGKAMYNEKLLYSEGKAIVIENDEIINICESSEAIEEYGLPVNHIDSPYNIDAENNVISVEGRAIIPGLIDSHSHMIWGGDRSREVRWKLQGKSYSEIANLGGGIGHTVQETKTLSEEDLYRLGRQRIETATRLGTTHIETKSGYGLTTESEIKLLSVAKKLQNTDHIATIDSTWLGAHATPKGHSYQSYTEEILSEQLPKVVDMNLARSADVFCEPGWFSIEQSEDILKESKRLGLDLRIHIDEFTDGEGGDLAAELSVQTADHCHYTNDENRLKMKERGVNTGFLPGTPFSMGEPWPSFSKMIDIEIPWTIASDFNPNNQVLSMPFLASILVQRCGIDPLVALTASTINPSFTTPHPSGMQHGCINIGAVANLNILHSKSWESWALQPGTNPFCSTMLNGQLLNND